MHALRFRSRSTVPKLAIIQQANGITLGLEFSKILMRSGLDFSKIFMRLGLEFSKILMRSGWSSLKYV